MHLVLHRQFIHSVLDKKDIADSATRRETP